MLQPLNLPASQHQHIIKQAAFQVDMTQGLGQFAHVTVELVRTGPIQQGNQQILGSSFPTFRITSGSKSPLPEQHVFANVSFSGATVMHTKTCQLASSNINVDLGRHDVNQFTGPGVATDWVNFDIALKDCPPFYGYGDYVFTERTGGTITGSNSDNAVNIGFRSVNGVVESNPLLAKIEALALVLLTIVPAQASIVITGTCVIYPAGDKDVTVKIDNQGDKPVLVQSWIDHGNPGATPETAKAPFTVTPPVNRINGGKGQMLRLMYTGEPLPANKESVFWLNVLEIPSVAKDKQNQLQVAFRSHIKIFYRPKGLAGEANKAGESVVWKRVSGGIEGSNPTPYFVSLAKITEDSEGKKNIAEGATIAPGSTVFIPMKKNLATIYPAYINDYGGITSVAQGIRP